MPSRVEDSPVLTLSDFEDASLRIAGASQWYLDALALILDNLAAAGVAVPPANFDDRQRSTIATELLTALNQAGFHSVAEKLRYGLDAAEAAVTKAREGENGPATQLLETVLDAAARASNPKLRLEAGHKQSEGSVSTGAFTLDIALGIGGLPRGRIVEIFGPESSGKTTLIYHVIAEAQRGGGICALIDAERSMDPGYAKRIGVDVDNLLISQPDTVEQALEITELLLRSSALDVVAIDSISALTLKEGIEGETSDSHVGLQARLMSQALRKLAGILNRTETICLFTNQLRERVAVTFAEPETTPGGRALKFYSSVRLDIRKVELLIEAGETVGNRVRVKVVKNKFAPPFRQAEFDILNGTGISWERTVVDAAIERGVVDHSGESFIFQGQMLGFTRGEAARKLVIDKALCQAILQHIGTVEGPDHILTVRPP